MRGFVTGVIDTPSKGVSRYTLAVLLLFTLALSACGGENQPPAESLLAVAYVNSDGQPGYSESDDILIAGLYDTNDDGVPSASDTVRYGQYPLDFAADELGTFTIADHMVESVSSANSNIIEVIVGTPSRVHFESTPTYQLFSINMGFVNVALFRDHYDPARPFTDVLLYDNELVLYDNTNAEVIFHSHSPFDNDFLNVQIF